MKRKSLLVIGMLILAAAVAAVGYTYWSSTGKAAAAEGDDQEVQTATVRQGNITISATGAGAVVPAQEINLGLNGGGTVTEILVQVGDQVQAGDMLAHVDDTAAQETVANAELQLSQARMQTDAQATEVGISFDDINVRQAELNLQEAQAALDDLLAWEPDVDEIAQAEAGLAAAEAGYNAALGQEASAGSNITLAQLEVAAAEEALSAAEEAVQIAYDPGRDWELYIDDPSCRVGEQHPNCSGTPYSENIKNEREVADNAVERAQENLQKAQINYQATVSSTNRSSSTSAEGNVLSAELALKAAQTGPTAEEISAAQTAVRQAELALQQAQLNRESNRLSLQQAQINVDAAEAALADTILTAPIAGTIMAVNGAVGETAASDLIVLADLEQPLLEIYLDETDLDKVGAGYEVEVVFDALPDDTFTGTVMEVDPQLSEVNAVSAIRALVQLSQDSFAKPQTLPVGLNATVEVIGGRATNAVLVPVEALRELSAGSVAVFVMEDGDPQLRMVEVGLMDFTYAEILNGLAVGEVVTTGLIVTE